MLGMQINAISYKNTKFRLKAIHEKYARDSASTVTTSVKALTSAQTKRGYKLGFMSSVGLMSIVRAGTEVAKRTKITEDCIIE